MNTSKLFFLVILSSLLTVYQAVGQKDTADTTIAGNQDVNPRLFKNVMYLTGGYVAGFSISGNYERILWQNPNQFLRSIQFRVGIGKSWIETWAFFYASDYELKTYTGTLGLLAGRRGSNLEFGMGATYVDGQEVTTWIFSNNDYKHDFHAMNLSIMMGYRYQKPGEYFIFRCGLGWPDGVYVSLGFCF